MSVAEEMKMAKMGAAEEMKMAKISSAEEFKRVSMEPIAVKALIKNLVNGDFRYDEALIKNLVKGDHFRYDDGDDFLWSKRWAYWVRISPNNIQLFYVGNVLPLKCAGKGTGPFQIPQHAILFPEGIPRNPRQMIEVSSSSGDGASFSTNPLFSVNSSSDGASLSTGDPLFTVMTYNVLAEVCATSKQFPNCPSYALCWEYRRQNIVKEILECDADIVCLQEVQHNHFCNYFEPELAKHGYEGVFQEKQRLCYLPTVDGCATFYKLKEFDLIESWWINLSDFAQGFPRFQKDNIALNLILSFKNSNSSERRLCIVNTHIHANPKNSDVKLWQVYYLLNNLQAFVHDNSDIPLVLCGDFNSLPGSAPHTLLTKGYIHPFYKEILDYDPSGELQLAQRFYHTLPLASAYSSYLHCINVSEAEVEKKMNTKTGEPHFTNCSKNFQGTLDYILHTATNLKVVSLLELIDQEEVTHGALPSLTHSSDHIPIAAKFQYIISTPKPPKLCCSTEE